MRIWLALSGLLAWLLWPSAALAHVGAPYPVLPERVQGPYVVSALADPDVGIGTFIVQVSLVGGEPVPTDTAVTLWVMPQDGHASETRHETQRQATQEGERFVGKVPFDTKGTWQTRLQVTGSAGREEVTFLVQVTPPYPGMVTTLLCLLPFVGLGILWAVGALRPRRRSATISNKRVEDRKEGN